MSGTLVNVLRSAAGAAVAMMAFVRTRTVWKTLRVETMVVIFKYDLDVVNEITESVVNTEIVDLSDSTIRSTTVMNDN